MIFIDIGVMQNLLGNNWKEILVAVFFIIWIVVRTSRKTPTNKNWLEQAQNRQQIRFDYLNPHTQKAAEKKWTSEGWYWDEEKQLWIAPDYLKTEAKRKWKWDEKKKIWTDLDKKQRLERYREFRKREGKEPTFEEWKAEKLRQEQQKNEHPEE